MKKDQQPPVGKKVDQPVDKRSTEPTFVRGTIDPPTKKER